MTVYSDTFIKLSPTPRPRTQGDNRRANYPQTQHPDCQRSFTRIWGFPKMRGTLFWVLTISILLFRVRYIRVPYFRKLPYEGLEFMWHRSTCSVYLDPDSSTCAHNQRWHTSSRTAPKNPSVGSRYGFRLSRRLNNWKILPTLPLKLERSSLVLLRTVAMLSHLKGSLGSR